MIHLLKSVRDLNYAILEPNLRAKRPHSGKPVQQSAEIGHQGGEGHHFEAAKRLGGREEAGEDVDERETKADGEDKEDRCDRGDDDYRTEPGYDVEDYRA